MHKIASIPGDGIGPEVVSATIQVVKKLASKLGFQVEFTHIPWGTNYYKEHGKFMSDDALDILRKFDAGLFGAVGDPDVPDHVSLWGLLLKIRSPLQLYANVRPVRTFPGTKSPLRTAKNGIDWVLVRENSEGEYCGQGGRSHIGHPWEAATEVAVFTRVAIERIMRFAFETARSRPRKKLTVVTKSNAMRHGMVLWDEVAAEVARDFPDVDWDKMLVDAITIRMVAEPDSLDTIVGTNLHMDILSDLAAGLAGSIGVAPSSNLDPIRQNPSLFEPVHGSAFDIAGKGVANPVATFWSAAEMLSWLGEKEAADKLMDCVERVCRAGILTADLGGKAKTQDVVDARPKSRYLNTRGGVRLASSDPFAPPLAGPARGNKLRASLTETPSLAAFNSVELVPGDNITSDEDLEAYIRGAADSLFHPSGTCAVGKLELGGVVDAGFRVHGVMGVRVVDANVLPMLPATHIQSSVYAIADMAADAILS
ncbi:hypothetical protein BDW75DRAFT_241495 [Aspergillus navahoensis]